MATVDQQHAAALPDRKPLANVNLVSLAVLFVAVVAIALILVGIAARGTTPITLLPPVVLGFVAILDLRK